MADICLIYAHSNKSVVRKLHALLAERYEIWWDEEMPPGHFRPEVERQLSEAKVVIPIWCRESRDRPHVIDEAEFATKRGVPLLPVRVENVDLPLGFGTLHTIDLLNWTGDPDADGVRMLLRSLGKIIGGSTRSLDRAKGIDFGHTSLPLPVFFRSVSSHETQLRPEEAVRALRLTGAEAILVSAYDMVGPDARVERIAEDLTECRSNGAVVLLDSGNYEADRKGDLGWNAGALREAMEATPHDFAFSFDNLNPPDDADAAIRDVLAAVERDSRQAPHPVLPIVHAPRTPSGRRSEVLPHIIASVARALRPPVVAVPERELGDGLVNRARAVYAIRRELDTLGYYQPLHLLGTGNPLSIAVLAAAGADCFDGLEWCRTVVDHLTARLYHFQQFDFFAWQSAVATSEVVREAITSDVISFSGKVVFHNLEFFRDWMTGVREMVSTRKVDRFLASWLPKGGDTLRLLEAAVPEMFA